MVSGLGTTARVLVVAAHPDDEDTRLIAWLQRGRHVETAYLSLTRGDGGQNLIGNELGEALGVIRTEELLAARRIDGARQYFTRAYDFGFSKSAEETFRHWPRDTMLGDVVRVVRAFRPQIIIAIFSGTPDDGHGHHQASGILAREAYDVSHDTLRFPARHFGAAWTVSKFYRSTSYRGGRGATYTYNAGEYSPLLGRSYAEIAAESRSQHKSQGFGQIERKGAIPGSLRREASRVNESLPAERERSIFDGLDTSIMAARAMLSTPRDRAGLDSVRIALARVREGIDLFAPASAVPALARASRLLGSLLEQEADAGTPDGAASVAPRGHLPDPLLGAAGRIERGLALATGAAVEATAPRDVVALGDSVPVTITVYNRGAQPLRFAAAAVGGADVSPSSRTADVVVQPDSSAQLRVSVRGERLTRPWWLATPRRGDLFQPTTFLEAPAADVQAAQALVTLSTAGTEFNVVAPVVFRRADPVRGEVTRPLTVAPAVSVTLDRTVELAPANAPLDRELRVQLRSADTSARDVRVTLRLPAGLTADSAARTVSLPSFGALRTATFRVRGRLAPGRHAIAALAESRGQTFAAGYVPIEYEHIRPQKLYRDAVVAVEAVDLRVPPGLTVAYIPGVGDNVAPSLRELGVPVTIVEPAAVAAADLSRFSTVVVGPRAYESSDALVASNDRLLDYARNGGTLVVQYGQYEMMRPGMMPYPITINRPHDRVTDEDSPVRILRGDHPLLTAPNRITPRDFEGWVQDRSLYMPRRFAEQYTPLLAMGDPGEQPVEGAILVAPYGRGTYVYTTIAFFRQLPAGVPGAARLFVNLLGAKRPGAAARAR